MSQSFTYSRLKDLVTVYPDFAFNDNSIKTKTLFCKKCRIQRELKFHNVSNFNRHLREIK